ncbi:MAG: LysO family transporter [Synergistetes bacterium]|nr:LysO family transporter [Synergistota bacterium]
MDIALFALTLALGIIIGKKKLAPDWLINRIDKALTVVIYILILLIGIEVGTYKEVLKNMGSIGVKAIAIALLSIAGSAYFSKLISGKRGEA